MANKSQTRYYGNSRFFELGSAGMPFRTVFNIDELANVRFEQDIREGEDGEAVAVGWLIVLLFRKAEGQRIAFHNEVEAVNCYNAILDMIASTGIPVARGPRLEAQPASNDDGAEQTPGSIVGPDGDPVAPLTDEELDALENPEIDEEAIKRVFEDD